MGKFYFDVKIAILKNKEGSKERKKSKKTTFRNFFIIFLFDKFSVGLCILFLML